MKLSIKTKEVDEELLMRVLDIKVGGKKATTPSKSVNAYVETGEMNEIHKGITLEKINEINEDNRTERYFNRNISKEMKDNSLNLVFLRYNDSIIPDEISMETIVDLQYHYTDALIVPSIPAIVKEYTGETLLNRMLSFIALYVETVEKMNNKSIIGMIPSKMPRQFIPNLIKYYHSNDITSFVIDSDGSSLYSNSSWLNSFKRELNKVKIEDEGFIYNLNPNPGKFMKKKDSVLAKDFILLPFGVDVIGNNHIPLKLPTDVWNQILAQRNKGPRIFNKGDYSYSRPENENIDYKVAKNNNMTAQYEESLTLQKVIKEENTAIDYLQSKEKIKEENVIGNIEKFKRRIAKDTGTSLF